MFLSPMSIALMIFASVLSALYLITLLCSSQYKSYIEPLSDKEFPLHHLYGIGFVLLHVIRYRFNTKTERKRRKCLELIYGERYADYYLQVIAAQRITISLTIAVFGLGLYGMVTDISMAVIILLFTFAAFYYFGQKPADIIKRRSDQLLLQFPDVVAKLALLINAGMIMKEAWKKIAENGEGLIYNEMRHAVNDMENGVSELDAYYDFGRRCVIPEIKKFTSSIMQGLLKGNKEFSIMISQQSKEVWEIKQHHVKQLGEKAASKLLIPILLMFIGILIMIIVPIFTNISV